MINYNLIGTRPEVQNLLNTLPDMIAEYELATEYELTLAPSLGMHVLKAAEHFYGLSIWDIGSIPALISAMKSADQNLMVR